MLVSGQSLCPPANAACISVVGEESRAPSQQQQHFDLCHQRLSWHPGENCKGEQNRYNRNVFAVQLLRVPIGHKNANTWIPKICIVLCFLMDFCNLMSCSTMLRMLQFNISHKLSLKALQIPPWIEGLIHIYTELGLAENVPAQDRGVGTKWSLRSLSTQTVPSFYDTYFTTFFLLHVCFYP